MKTDLAAGYITHSISHWNIHGYFAVKWKIHEIINYRSDKTFYQHNLCKCFWPHFVSNPIHTSLKYDKTKIVKIKKTQDIKAFH